MQTHMQIIYCHDTLGLKAGYIAVLKYLSPVVVAVAMLMEPILASKTPP